MAFNLPDLPAVAAPVYLDRRPISSNHAQALELCCGVLLDYYRYLGFASSITGNNSPHRGWLTPVG